MRNGTLLGYPYVESIRSILPLVDEFVINIGVGDDDTFERVALIGDPKVRIIRSLWNDNMRCKGFVYAQQKMIAQYNCTGDWAFYLEGDEVLHENDLDRIRASMLLHLPNPKIEALAFRYLHFYGGTSQVATSAAWYRNEARVIRNSIRSYAPDGLYWVVMDHRKGRYPKAAHTGAHIYHYGWARSAAKLAEKTRRVAQYWDGLPPSVFDYGNIDPEILVPFTGQHPAIMAEWIRTDAEHDFKPNPNYQLTRREKKHRLSAKLENWLGWDLSKKHYRSVK